MKQNMIINTVISEGDYVHTSIQRQLTIWAWVSYTSARWREKQSILWLLGPRSCHGNSRGVFD